MAFVQFSKVSLAFGNRDVLKEVGLNIDSSTRAALAGANGAGKTTLMKVIAGSLQPDSGERAVQRGCRIAYLPQSGIVHRGSSLREEVERVYDSVMALFERLEAVGMALENTTGDGGITAALLEEHHQIQERIENSGYYEREGRIDLVLSGLGFESTDQGRRVEEFSGGWQMRIALAKILLGSPDILLLDEPTNYLDIEARTWLQSWLQDLSGGYILVSHDRYFLDVTVKEVYELFQGSLKGYVGNYSAYEQIRQGELESLVKRYAAQQEEIAAAEALIRRFRYKASKAAMVQERIKKLDKMERIELPESFKKIHITLPPPPHSGRIALTLRSLSKSYGDTQALSDLDLTVESGERLVVVGRNGAGKSTLLRIIAGEDRDYQGEVIYGAGIAVGYFSQDAAERLGAAAPNLSVELLGAAAGASLLGAESAAAALSDGTAQTETPWGVLEFLESESPTALIPRLRDMLGAFLFRGDDVYKPLAVLSGGERSRLALLQMLLKPMNLLILDEPTNHLDLYSKDILLEALGKYSGTIIFVSHDRAFMEALSTKTLELQAGRPRLFYGNYSDYSRPPLAQSPPVGFNGRSVLISAGTALLAPSPRVDAAEKRERDKQRQAQIRRLEKREAEILTEMEKAEAERARLEAELARPEVYTRGEKARKIKQDLDALAEQIAASTVLWEVAAEELAQTRSV